MFHTLTADLLPGCPQLVGEQDGTGGNANGQPDDWREDEGKTNPGDGAGHGVWWCLVHFRLRESEKGNVGVKTWGLKWGQDGEGVEGVGRGGGTQGARGGGRG